MLFLFKKPATLTLSAKIITFFRLPKHSSGKTVIRHKLPIFRTFPCHSSQKDAKYPKILEDWRIKHNFAFVSRRNATIYRENKATKAA